MVPCNGCAGGSGLSPSQKASVLSIELPLFLSFTSSDVKSVPTRLNFVTVRIRGKTVVLSGLDFRSCSVNGFIGFRYLGRGLAYVFECWAQSLFICKRSARP